MDNQKKILIADGDPVNRDFFEVMLSKLGFEVEKAADGAEALEAVKRFAPDLVLMDNLLSRVSGWELTRVLKNDAKYRDISIIIFSPLDDVKEKVEAFDLGADDYITKPFNFSEVLARIRAVLRGRELFSQLKIRESRLSLAEGLGIRASLREMLETIDAAAGAGGTGPGSAKALQTLRHQITELDGKIAQTATRWEDLKKQEINLPEIETRLRKEAAQKEKIP